MIVESVPPWAVNAGKLFVTAAVFFAFGRGLVRPMVQQAVSKRADMHLAKPVARAAYYLTVLFGIAVGLVVGGFNDVFGVLGTVVAAGTVAIGFAMKDTLAAVVAGVFIFFDKPFKIGDWVEWDEYSGTVEDIRIRTTRIKTFDNEVITVPNDKIANAAVKNLHAKRKLRLKTEFGISYDDDIDTAREIITAALEDIDKVLDEPEPRVHLVSLGDSSVDLTAFYWVRSPSRRQYVNIREDLLQQVKERFDEEEIDIPYPTTTIIND